MLKAILEIIQKPQLLAQSAMIKKSFIRKVVLLLSVIVAIPIGISNWSFTQQSKQDFNTITQHLPQFKTTDTIVTGEENSKVNHAIQTDTSYFLYDIENNVSQSTKDELVQKNLFTFIITKAQYSVFMNGIQVIDNAANSYSISTSSVKENIQSLSHVLSIVLWLTPLTSIVTALIVILFNNIFYTIAARLLFLMNNKIVHWVHLWRVSLFASIVPYVLFSILSALGMSIPFEHLIILVYTLVIQWQVLQNVSIK